MSDSTIERLNLKDIKATAKNQTREALDKEAVQDYKAHILAAQVKGADPDFDPLVAFRDMSGEVYLSDGFHRRAALLGCDILEYKVEVFESEDAKRDAVKYGFRANIAHGVRLTNADKIHNLMLALEDKEWAELNNTQLAELIGVSESFVRTNRPKGKAPAKVKTRAGREIDTTNIGKKTGNAREAERAEAKQAKKKGKKAPKAEAPKTDAALEKAYAKLLKALEGGEAVVEAIKNGTLPISRADILKWTTTSDDRVRQISELVVGKRWKVNKAIAMIDGTLSASTKADHLMGLAIAHGGLVRERIESFAFIILKADDYEIGETKEGVITIKPKGKKKK